MGRQSRSVTRGSEVTDANPEGVEFQCLSMFNPFRVASSMDHSHGFRLALHPWLFTLIPAGDAVVVYAEYGLGLKRRTMDLSNLLDGLTGELEPIRDLALRLVATDGQSEVLAESISLSHRPRIGSEAFALRLYAPVRDETIRRYETIHNFKISDHYRVVLQKLNGTHAFEFSLFGIPPSMAKIPPLLDRSTAQPYDLNQHWRREYALEGDLFHFGGGPYSQEENVGYFFDEVGVIYAFRKNGTSIGRWNAFRSFLADELRRAEEDYPRFESSMEEVQKKVAERKPWWKRRF